MFNIYTKLNSKDLESSYQKIFQETQIHQCVEQQSNLFPDDFLVLLDENTEITSEIIEEINPFFDCISLQNDKISIVQHDQPVFITEQQTKLRNNYSIDDYQSFKNILIANNQSMHDNSTKHESDSTQLTNGVASKEQLIPDNHYINRQHELPRPSRKSSTINLTKINSYKSNIYESQYLPEFLLYNNFQKFVKSKLDEFQFVIDEKGINFIFDISDSASNKILLCLDQTVMKVTFQNTKQLISSEIIDKSSSEDNQIMLDLPLNTEFVHFKIYSFTRIKYIGFIYSFYDKIQFNQSIYEHLQFSLVDQSQNTLVMANIFNIEEEDVIDNRVPLIIYNALNQSDENANEHIQGLFNDFTEITHSDDNEQVVAIHPKLVGKLDHNQKLFLYISKNNSNHLHRAHINDQLSNNLDHKRNSMTSGIQETMEKENYSLLFMNDLISQINEESFSNHDFLIEIDQNNELIKLIFESTIVDLVSISLYRFTEEQSKQLIEGEYDHNENCIINEYKQSDSILHYNLLRLRQIRPWSLYRFDELNLWFVAGLHNSVLNDRIELMSNTKDPIRSQMILNEFIKQFQSAQIEKFINTLKGFAMQDCIASLQVDQNLSLVWIDEKISNNGSAKKSLRRSSFGKQSSMGMDSVIFSSANHVKGNKYFYFADSEKFKQIRLIGLMFLYFLRPITNDFKFNKENLRIQFQNKKKYQEPFSMIQKNLTNPVVCNLINELPLFQKWTLQNYSVQFMDRKIDWMFSLKFLDEDGLRQDFVCFVCLEKGVALLNSPHSYLFPLPAILYFKDYLKHDLTKDDILNPTDVVKEGVEYYLRAFINEETGIMVNTLLIEKYKNDIIQNTQFKLFDQAYEVKLSVINFIREIAISDSQYFSLQNYRIQNISQKLTVKNDLMLIRYTNYKDNFEVSRLFQESKRDDFLKFNGLNFQQEDHTKYRSDNKQFNDGSSIVTVYTRVCNRCFNIEEQLMGIYNNFNEPSIQDQEIIRDIIDYITQKQLIIPYSVQVQFYLFTILLQLPMVQNQLLIVEPEKLEEKNLTGFLVTAATILLIVEIFFVAKLVLEITIMNILTNYSIGIQYYFTLFDIIVTKTILSEKILSIANNAGLIQTSFIIYQNITNNIILDSVSMRIMLVSCFICIFNLINFMSYFSFTQKLVITLIEIFKDLRWTMFVAFTLIMCLTSTIWGIESLKHYLVDEKVLLELTTSMAAYKTWISPQNLKTYSFMETIYYSISLALMGDTFIFSEQYQLISLLLEEEVVANEKLSEGILVIKSLEVIWQAIVIIVIVAQIVVLLNFVIAIMADTYGKVTENFLMQTQRLKASQLVEWHWLLQLYIQWGMTEDERYVQPWKICLLNPSDSNEETWNGQIQVIKRFMGEQIKKVETRMENLNKISTLTERKVEEISNTIDAMKEDMKEDMKENIKQVFKEILGPYLPQNQQSNEDFKTVIN